MGILPIRESSFRLARLELVARPIDQGSGLAMNASDGIGPKGSDGAKAVQENIVRYRLHDAGYAGHIELERADAVLLGIAGNFLDLLLGKNLRVENRIDVAALVHCFAERRQVLEIRILQAAQKDSDRGDSTEDCGAGLGLSFAFVRLLVTEMNMRVKNAGQHGSPARVVYLGRLLRQIRCQYRDLAVGDSYVGLDPADTGNHQRPVANDQVERFGIFVVIHHVAALSSTSESATPARVRPPTAKAPATSRSGPPRDRP